MAGQVIHTVSSEKVENLWITGEILTIQIAELALDNSAHKAFINDLANSFSFRLQQKHEFLKSTLDSRKKILGEGICAYGIGNRALHLFAFADLQKQIDYFVDSNNAKHGYMIPYYKTTLKKPIEVFTDKNKVHTIFVTAFGYEKEVIKQLKTTYEFRPDLQIIQMDPAFSFLHL